MATKEASISEFGLFTAYLVPGATVLLGLSEFSETLRMLFLATSSNEPTIGGFLYLTVAATAMGMTVSAVRWLLIDRLHAATGLRIPVLDFTRLGDRVEALQLLIEIHYRHYLFYGNMAVATAVAYAAYRIKVGHLLPITWFDVGVFALEGVFLATSRDTLAKYYSRAEQLLHAKRGKS